MDTGRAGIASPVSIFGFPTTGWPWQVCKSHRSLIPLGSCDGHYQDPQRGGGSGGVGLDLIPLGKKKSKSKRNKENRHFSEQITGNNRRKSHRSTRIPSVISWHSKIFGPAGHQLTIIHFMIIFQLLRLHDRLYQ